MHKIPEFPNFKKIELLDKNEINQFINKLKFPPYADYNFINIWTWDVEGKMMLSRLNDNLVVLFSDYVTNQKFLSFWGINLIFETATILIEYSIENYHHNELRLIPEEISIELLKCGFIIKQDRNSCDYIYEIEDLANINNWPKKNNHRKNIMKFISKYPEYKVEISRIDKIHYDIYLKMFKKWSENKKIENYLELNEYKAFKRLFDINDKNTNIISIFVDGLLMGFTVFEIISKDYAVAHFSKADTVFNSGIYDILIWEEAKTLNIENIKYYNFEQDLGITGLRYMKQSFHPIFLLEKFNISN